MTTDLPFRTGFGYDVHRLVEGRPLVLGGVTIPFPLGLLGHSDADVLIHALCDAILGACALGDIGRHFPDSDPIYRGIPSMRLLEETIAKAWERGYLLGNADLTLVAERPRISPYAEEMRGNVARACRVPPERINIKGTTSEGLGFTGTGEGIAAYAVALLIPGP